MTIRSEPRASVAPAQTFWRATAEVVEASQRVVVDRVELLRTELADDAKDLAVAIGVVVAAGVVVLVGWVFLAVAAAFLLAEFLPWAAATAIVGTLHVVLGAALARAALRRFNQARRMATVAVTDPAASQVLRG
jgi:hypothetical protein